MKYTNIVVLNADGIPDKSGDVIAIDGIVLPNQVVVTREFDTNLKELLGKATLTKKENQIIADIEIFNSDSLLIPFLTPAVGGKILERNGSIITKCEINQIGLSVSENADPRIKRLGDS